MRSDNEKNKTKSVTSGDLVVRLQTDPPRNISYTMKVSHFNYVLSFNFISSEISF
jgi:hypothetical protein